MSQIYLFNKPYGVLTQFTDSNDRPVLADYIDVPAIYPAGRLDKDSEGLLLLTDDGKLQQAVWFIEKIDIGHTCYNPELFFMTTYTFPALTRSIQRIHVKERPQTHRTTGNIGQRCQ